MPEVKWAIPKAPKQVVELFNAKKEVTKKDAQKLNPLTKFWSRKIRNVFTLGFLSGGLFACAIIGLLSFFGV